MKKTRPPKRNNKFYLPKHEYWMTVHFCMNYGEYKRKLAELDGQKGVVYDGMPHGTDVTDPTAVIAEKRQKIQGKIDIIENAIKDVDPNLYEWLLLGITGDGYSYRYLHDHLGMPCGKDYYIKKYREVYYRIAQEI